MNYYQKKTMSLKVISFCLWGKEKRYLVGLIKNIELTKLYYPEFICFIYIHKNSVPSEIFDQLIGYDNIRIFIKNDPFIRPKRFMLWRLEPLLEFDVEYVISRDIDTRIQPREVLAVREWIASNKSLHIMRDHPCHYNKILGGMFGIKKSSVIQGRNWIGESNTFYKIHGEQKDDQDFLLCFYELFSNDRIIHDEIKKYEGNECRNFPIPFEQNGHFVGCYIYEDESIDISTTNILRQYLHHHLSHRISKYKISLGEKISHINSKINNIYIMHYTKLHERKKIMKNQLTSVLLNNITWIESFDRENLNSKQLNECYKYDSSIVPRPLTIGEKANHIAHNFILEKIRDNDELSIVFEDDTIFKDDFIHHLYYVLHNLPNDFDLICLGGPTEKNVFPCHSLDKCTKIHFMSDEIDLFRPATPAPCTMSSMLVTNKGAEKLLSSQKMYPFSSPIDHSVWLASMEKDIKMYWVQPWITFESSKSDYYQNITTSLDKGF